MKSWLNKILNNVPNDLFFRFIMGLLICQTTTKSMWFTNSDHYIEVLFGFCTACVFAFIYEFIDNMDGDDVFDEVGFSVSLTGAFIGAILLI